MSLHGFTMAMFRLDTLVEQSLQGMPCGLGFADVTDAASKYLLTPVDASRVASFTFVPRQSAQTEAIRAGVHWRRLSPSLAVHGLCFSIPWQKRGIPMPNRVGHPRRRAAVHAAPGWALHSEGEIVSTGPRIWHVSIDVTC